MRRSVYFQVHGILVEVIAKAESQSATSAAFQALDALERDFLFFRTQASRKITIRIRLFEKSWEGSSRSLPRRIFQTHMGEARGWGDSRLCRYGQECWACFQKEGETSVVEISSPQFHDLYETAYITWLSRVGEELDRRAFHRVHALGFEANGKACLVFGESGRGKSALAYQILRHTNWKLFSDETPLVKDFLIYPFPTRIALQRVVLEKLGGRVERVFSRRLYGEKALVDIPPERVARPCSIHQVFFLGRKSRWHFLDLITGKGYAQMAEQVLRGTNTLELFRSALSRTQMAIRIQRQIPKVTLPSDNGDAEKLFLQLKTAMKKAGIDS